MDLEVGGGERKTAGADIRAVLETWNFLLGVGREAEPPKLRADGVPEPVVGPRPGPRIPLTRVSVVTFRVVPGRPPAAGRSAGGPASARTPSRAQGKTKAETRQHRVLRVEKTQAVLGGSDCEPDGRPGTGAGLNPHPIGVIRGRPQSSPASAVERLGKNPLLPGNA